MHITNYYYRNDGGERGYQMTERNYPMPDYTQPRMDYAEPIRNTYPTYRDERYEQEYKPVVGFGDRGGTYSGGNMRYMYPETRNEMSSMSGSMERGHGSSESYPKATREIAEGWLKDMKNVDGTSGQHWSYDQCKQVMQQRGYNADPIEWWVAMNMMYSDYCKVAKRMGLDNVDFYASMADAFLNDPDADENKLSTYMYCIK